MTRERRADAAERCFYCDGMVRTTGVGDHFPIPKRHGGTVTVPCCDSCHDMKDRFRLEDWPTEWVGVVVGQWPELRRETRIFLAKAMALFSEALEARIGEPTKTVADRSAARAWFQELP